MRTFTSKYVEISCTAQEALAIYTALLACQQGSNPMGAVGARVLAKVKEALAPRPIQENR